MTPLMLLLGVLWVALGLGAHAVPSIAGTLVGAGVGATVSVAVYAATRAQARRQTTLDLFKEYYSADFADLRRKAERFMIRHAQVDWSINDPYLLGAADPDLVGYGAVLRYWQRVSTFYREGEVSRGLLQRLLARELGFWNVRIFKAMAARKGMYVRGPIVDLAYRMSIGEARSLFEEGERDGRRTLPPELEQTGPRRQNTIA
jgi:hypothetical protein